MNYQGIWLLKNKENIKKVLKVNNLTKYTSIKSKIWLVKKVIWRDRSEKTAYTTFVIKQKEVNAMRNTFMSYLKEGWKNYVNMIELQNK